MSASTLPAVHALNQSFLHHHPISAARAAGKLNIADLVELLEFLPETDRLSLWDYLTADRAGAVLTRMSPAAVKPVLLRGDPVELARILARMPLAEREALMRSVDAPRRRELTGLMEYPEDSAGALMDPAFMTLYESLTVREALHRIRKFKPKFSRQLYLIDGEGRLQSMVELHRLALAEGDETLGALVQPVPAVVPATADREDVVEQLDYHRVTDLPVIDINGRLIGIIRYDVLMDAIRDESSADLLTMVGASPEERALSNIGFVVKKRLPWLSVNLLTAFLAASVVGLFESIIAQFTALAVLLPVVAGQSGNTGAQALAVTMRGLALREIGTSQWFRVARKEIGAGFINGLSIAVITAVGVYVWSSSLGLTMVIGISMVLTMVAAAFSGVIIPVTLSKLGQDPAQASSIFLTTVTDVVGFFAFLGIATLLAGLI